MRHAEYGAIQIDVLAAGAFGVKPGADLEHARDLATDRHPAFARLGNA